MPYPAWDYNRGAQLLAQLGSFWAEIFDDRNRVQSHLQSSGHEYHQTYLNFLESVACVSRLDIPVFHREYWKLLSFKLSEMNSVKAVYEEDDLVYGTQPGTRPFRPSGYMHQYGGVDNPYITQIPLPEGLKEADYVIQNKVLDPSRIYVNGLDYDIDRERNLLRLRNNIFNDTAVPKRDIYDAQGNKVDEEAVLWLYQGDWDLDYIYIQFGYAIGLHLPSSQFYKDLLNAFWDAHVLGPSVSAINSMLAAAAGAPTILEAEETVELIRTESDRKLVITDKNVYEIPLAATSVLSVGQTAYAGDVVSDAIKIYEFSGSNPDYSQLPQISIGNNLVSGGYWSGLTFKNTSVPLQYLGLDTDGKAVVQFEVNGFPNDVSAWWDRSLALGKQPGNKTLAELLDTRSSPIGQPTPADLPSVINPMEFCFENFFGNNMFLIKIHQASFSANAPGTAYFGLLREVLPPHISYVMFVELEPEADNISLDDAVDSPTGLVVGNPSDSISGMRDVGVTARHVAWNCA